MRLPRYCFPFRLSRKREAILLRRTLALILLLTLTVWATAALYHKAAPIALDNAALLAAADREALLYESVEALLAEGGYTYDSFACHETDASGKVYAIKIRTEALSAFRASLYEKARDALKQAVAIAVEIPVGSLLAPEFFSGKGFSLTVRATAYTALTLSLTSEVTAVGVNRSLHRIALSVHADTNLYCMGEKHSFTQSLSLPLAETLVWGDPPQGFFEYTP